MILVPINGVPLNVGEFAKTNAPVPVSPVTAAAKLALVGVARNVATLVPRSESSKIVPLLSGSVQSRFAVMFAVFRRPVNAL